MSYADTANAEPTSTAFEPGGADLGVAVVQGVRELVGGDFNLSPLRLQLGSLSTGQPNTSRRSTRATRAPSRRTISPAKRESARMNAALTNSAGSLVTLINPCFQ